MSTVYIVFRVPNPSIYSWFMYLPGLTLRVHFLIHPLIKLNWNLESCCNKSNVTATLIKIVKILIKTKLKMAYH